MGDVTSAVFELPFPVPLHACFIKSKGGSGIPSKRYKQYGWNAQAKILEAGSPRVSGPVSVMFYLNAPDKRPRDGDNLFKCLMDTLVNNGVIEDDSNKYVKKEGLEWVDAGPPCTVVIERYQSTVMIPIIGSIS